MGHYLNVVTDKRTGLFHGAVFRLHSTPSGSKRWLLAATLDKGFKSARMAAAAVNEAFPDIAPINVDAVNDVDLARFDGVPAGSVLTVASARDLQEGTNKVEFSLSAPDGFTVDTTMKPSDLAALLATGRLVPDSSSGDDPELTYRYDHYVFGRVA